MNQTPLQKAIDKLTETHGMIISTSRYAEGFAEGLSGAIEELKQLLPYEEEYIKEQIRKSKTNKEFVIEICDCEIPKPIDAYHEIDKYVCKDCSDLISNI